MANSRFASDSTGAVTVEVGLSPAGHDGSDIVRAINGVEKASLAQQALGSSFLGVVSYPDVAPDAECCPVARVGQEGPNPAALVVDRDAALWKPRLTLLALVQGIIAGRFVAALLEPLLLDLVVLRQGYLPRLGYASHLGCLVR